MRHAWIRAVFVVVLMALIGGCDSSQKPETQSPSAESSPQQEATSEQKASDMSEQEATDTNAASGEQQGSSSLWVMQPRGNRQCEGGGKSLASSGAELAQNGIKVQESRCGVRTDRMYPSVCGGATGDLLMHRIPASFLDAALELGFDPAKQGQYKLVDCPQMPAGGPQDR
ncbi:hypothetical protein [Microbulbifer elongatus]|uniref:hypothetical protein n=1 Tax=Microbulbifer elongatus TaxID=86173 RepID=UPI001CFD2CDA|nr:hypothetical protein [Microbulbifer elongatus]